ncbi:hypothetical protein NUU61_003083 [Penicillium alfredii]|uniref:Uncharacterized protein n=1 Tax=Penicillium alfredii TaxID=1506179 RepID=A0A9W9KH60_9EURO|nr:uncharacterized protein NUU61_003083 [Penicillium alfredii]KAJ5105736.1 hypothetical protein NUU61_003083 [Penicillium alfredii]
MLPCCQDGDQGILWSVHQSPKTLNLGTHGVPVSPGCQESIYRARYKAPRQSLSFGTAALGGMWKVSQFVSVATTAQQPDPIISAKKSKWVIMNHTDRRDKCRIPPLQVGEIS